MFIAALDDKQDICQVSTLEGLNKGFLGRGIMIHQIQNKGPPAKEFDVVLANNPCCDGYFVTSQEILLVSTKVYAILTRINLHHR